MLSSPHKRIWALLDDRQGNTNQTLGVAEALGVPFEIKKIEFNEFIRIPNFIINKTTLGLTRRSAEQLHSPWPDIIICTARRLGIVASYIQSQNPDTFIAQIQWPGIPSKHFDLIAAPKHDNVPPGDNIFTSIGAPHRVTPEILARDAEIWGPKVAGFAPPRIAVLVGGSARSYTFTVKHARKLAMLSSELAKALGGSLLVTTSRRTGEKVEGVIAEHLTVPHFLYIWNRMDSVNGNPFYGFLGLADAVIATGDSISMCSEACATGKPVFVYTSSDFMPKKHQAFVKELFRLNLARPLAKHNNELFIPSHRLDDSADIAQEIKKRALPELLG